MLKKITDWPTAKAFLWELLLKNKNAYFYFSTVALTVYMAIKIPFYSTRKEKNDLIFFPEKIIAKIFTKETYPAKNIYQLEGPDLDIFHLSLVKIFPLSFLVGKALFFCFVLVNLVYSTFVTRPTTKSWKSYFRVLKLSMNKK